MAESRATRRRPSSSAVVRALNGLGFQFDQRAQLDGVRRLVGFGPDSVVEIVEGPPLTVALLFSASPEREAMLQSTMTIVTLATALRVNCTGWLSYQLRRGRSTQGWRASRRFGLARVSAEHLSQDAVLLTVESAPAA